MALKNATPDLLLSVEIAADEESRKTFRKRQLSIATMRNDLESFKSILAGHEVNEDNNMDKLKRGDDWKKTLYPLHVAATTGRNELIPLLLEAGFDVDAVSEWKPPDRPGDPGSPWNPDTSHHQDLLASSSNATALHLAVYGHKLATAKLLLDLGANKCLKGEWGYLTGTPLAWANQIQANDVRDSREEFIKLLELHVGEPMSNEGKSIPKVLSKLHKSVP